MIGSKRSIAMIKKGKNMENSLVPSIGLIRRKAAFLAAIALCEGVYDVHSYRHAELSL